MNYLFATLPWRLQDEVVAVSRREDIGTQLKRDAYMKALLGRASKLFSSVFDKPEAMRIEEAIVLASWLHAGQYRRTGEPYLAHLLRVARLLLRSGVRDVEILIAALLHDSEEDAQHRLPPGGLVTWGLSEQVAALVSALTKDKSRHPIEYFEQVRKMPLARIIKQCDKYDNLRSMHGAFSLEKQREYMNETHALLLICGTKSGGLGRYVGSATMLEGIILTLIDSTEAAIAKRIVNTDAARTFLTISGGVAL